MVRYFWSTNPIVLRDLARRREDALGADLRAPVAEIARRAREAMLANPGFARWRVPRCARTHRSLGPTVRIWLPPPASRCEPDLRGRIPFPWSAAPLTVARERLERLGLAREGNHVVAVGHIDADIAEVERRGRGNNQSAISS